jgi:hypothetical protein
MVQFAVRHNRTLESIVDAFEQFDQCLPRFQYYIEAFGSWHSSERFRRSVVQYYAEFIKQCQEALQFLRCNQISKKRKYYRSRISCLTSAAENLCLLGHASRLLDGQSARRIQRLHNLTAWIDKEASIVNAEQLRNRVNEILLNITPRKMSMRSFPYHNLPYMRNAAFFDRDHEMGQLSKLLSPIVRPKTLVQIALSGLGGAGKSQIALEYAYRTISNYDAVFWVSCESAVQLGTSVAAQVSALRLISSDTPQQQNQLRDLFKGWLFDVGRRGKTP